MVSRLGAARAPARARAQRDLGLPEAVEHERVVAVPVDIPERGRESDDGASASSPTAPPRSAARVDDSILVADVQFRLAHVLVRAQVRRDDHALVGAERDAERRGRRVLFAVSVTRAVSALTAERFHPPL